MELHGFLAVDKPLGWTSHDVVGRIRRVAGTRRVGHAGTLDPAATGVLVVGIGRATRFMNLVQDSSKGYVAHVALGRRTNSFDLDGRLEAESIDERFPSLKQVNQATEQLVGEIDQVPPKYSAIKQSGEPLYRRLRRGEDVEVPVRRVRIQRIAVLEYDPPDLVLDIECGSGVYIRSLAVDLGEALGSGAYLHHLVRTRVGAYHLRDCWTLDELNAPAHRYWANVALATDSAATDLPALCLSKRDEDAWYHGRSVMTGISAPARTRTVRAYTQDGAFGGLGAVRSNGSRRGVNPQLVLPAGRGGGVGD